MAEAPFWNVPETRFGISRVSFLSEVEVPPGDRGDSVPPTGQSRLPRRSPTLLPPCPSLSWPPEPWVGACPGCVLGRSRVPEEGSR